MLSMATSKGPLRVQLREAAQGPDREDVPIVRVADGTALVEDSRDVLLRPVTTGELLLKQTPDSSFLSSDVWMPDSH